MNAADFNAWMKHMKLNILQTAVILELSRNTVKRYMKEGAPSHIAYACAALSAGIAKWAR